MIKQFSAFTILMLLLATSAYAGDDVQKEKVVTAKWSFVSGKAKVADHFLSDQEHNGQLLGLSMEFGSFYKKSENVLWDLDITYITAPYSALVDGISLVNPAKTSGIALNNLRADYGTYYNWNPVKNLNIKAGGRFDLLAGVNIGKPNYVNNLFDLDFQTQLKAAAGIRYGWNFKKWGLFLYAEAAVPFMGLAMGGSVYQGSIDSLIKSEILPGTINIIHFTSFHNLTGFNAEFGIDLVFGHTTLFFTSEYNNRWWNLHDVQNYRLYNLSKIGLMVDLVARNRIKSNSRFF